MMRPTKFYLMATIQHLTQITYLNKSIRSAIEIIKELCNAQEESQKKLLMNLAPLKLFWQGYPLPITLCKGKSYPNITS